MKWVYIAVTAEKTTDCWGWYETGPTAEGLPSLPPPFSLFLSLPFSPSLLPSLPVLILLGKVNEKQR